MNVELTHQDYLSFLSSLADSSVDLIVTDPPYSTMNRRLKLGSGRIVGKYADRGQAGARWFDEPAFHLPEVVSVFLAECQRVLRPDRHIYVMSDPSWLPMIQSSMDRQFETSKRGKRVAGVKNLLTWNKVYMGQGYNFRRQTEFIVFASKGKRPARAKNFSDLWTIKSLRRSPFPTQKPVELFERMIAASKHPSDGSDFLVCDPFLGSGSSAIAALRQGCAFIGCDAWTSAITLARSRVAAFQQAGADPLEPKRFTAFKWPPTKAEEAAARRATPIATGISPAADM